MGEISRRAMMLGAAAVGAAASAGLPRLATGEGKACEEALAWAARLGGVTLNAGEYLECGWSRMHFWDSAFLVSDRFVQATLPCRNEFEVLAPGGGRLLLATRKADSGREFVPARVVDVLRRDHPQSVQKRQEADAAARRNAWWHRFMVDATGADYLMRFQDDRMMVFYEMQRCEKLREAIQPMWVMLGESWDGMNVYEVRRGANAVADRGIDRWQRA